MKTFRHKKGGFTLVEVLVVITIIAVLVAVVFTATARMKRSANQAVTTANMKQIGIAMLTFTADNGRFPSQMGDPVWDRAIMSNLGFLDTLNASGSIKRSTYPQLEATAKIFTTPEDKEKRDPSLYQRSFAIVPWTTNWSNGTAFRGWKDLPTKRGITYATLAAPERSAMVVQWFEGNYGASGRANLLGSGDHGYHDMGGPATAIGDQQQVLFADGHIEKLSGKLTNKQFVDKYWPGTIGNL